MLFILSVGVVIAMDMLVQIPLHVSFNNIVVPFKAMMVEETVIISLILLYVFSKPVVLHFMKKK
jgi:hypothetical protein